MTSAEDPRYRPHPIDWGLSPRLDEGAVKDRVVENPEISPAAFRAYRTRRGARDWEPILDWRQDATSHPVRSVQRTRRITSMTLGLECRPVRLQSPIWRSVRANRARRTDHMRRTLPSSGCVVVTRRAALSRRDAALPNDRLVPDPLGFASPRRAGGRDRRVTSFDDEETSSATLQECIG